MRIVATACTAASITRPTGPSDMIWHWLAVVVFAAVAFAAAVPLAAAVPPLLCRLPTPQQNPPSGTTPMRTPCRASSAASPGTGSIGRTMIPKPWMQRFPAAIHRQSLWLPAAAFDGSRPICRRAMSSAAAGLAGLLPGRFNRLSLHWGRCPRSGCAGYSPIDHRSTRGTRHFHTE